MEKIINMLTLKGPKERIVIILFGLIFLRVIPINSLDCFNLCLWERIFGNTNHYSHGITHAMCAFLKGDMQLAYSYNKLVFFVMGIIFTILMIDTVKLIMQWRKKT